MFPSGIVLSRSWPSRSKYMFRIFSSKFFKRLLFKIRALTPVECIYVNDVKQQSHFICFHVDNHLSQYCSLKSLVFSTDAHFPRHVRYYVLIFAWISAVFYWSACHHANSTSSLKLSKNMRANNTSTFPYFSQNFIIILYKFQAHFPHLHTKFCWRFCKNFLYICMLF